MSTPLVSVIIPVFDGEAYLEQALLSLLDQDHPRIETIVVDDASTDRSAAIARRFAGIVLLARRSRGGPGAARNTGLRVASGSHIAFLDSDDVMFPNRISVQLDHLQRTPALDAVFCLQRYRLEGSTEAPRWLRQRQRRHLAKDVATGMFAAMARGDAQPLSILARREVFDRVGPFEEGVFKGEDSEWLFRARAAGVRFGTVDRVLMERRIHGRNLTYSDDALGDALLELARHKARTSRSGPSDDSAAAEDQ